MNPWDVLVPPLGGDDLLRRRIARVIEPRLRRVLRRARLGRVPHPDVSFLAGGRLRGWMHAAEEALGLLGANDMSDLVARVSDLGLLAVLAPSGRIPRDFAARAHRAARTQLARLRRELPLVLRPDLPHPVREDVELGRPAGTHRPTSAGPEVGALVRTRGTEVTLLGADPRFELQVGHALVFLGATWPEAVQMVLRRTWRVVPVVERGIVSYSSAARPGVTWIQRSLGRARGVEGAMHLAEHLLHEGTHQRVHDLEVMAPIAPSEEEGPRFYSPWRREWRPLRGLLHGACTFTVGAGYFARVLRALEEDRVVLDASVRPWLTRRFLEEMENVRVALRYLQRAELPRMGERLLATVKREHVALRSEAHRRRAGQSEAERAHVETHARTLRVQPLRWG